MADDAGALLVRSGLVTTSALEAARANVIATGGTLGEHLVGAGAIADDALTSFYRERLLVTQVNPNQLARLPAKVVGAIPAEMAVELRAIPVALDADNNLTIAMSDPSDRHAVDEIAFFTGAYVVRAVATQMQIAWCLAHYYKHVTALGGRLMQPAAAPATPAPATPASSGPLPRVKGLTAEINAQRKHAIAPGDGHRAITEPLDDSRGESAPEALADRPSDGIPAAPIPRVTPGSPSGRAHTVSGEIRVPLPRAQSVKPEPRIDPDESGPMITVEVLDEVADKTAPVAAPVRKRKAKTDPPELAARAGELSIVTGTLRRVTVDADEPRIVVAMEPEPEPTTTIIDDEADGVVIREGLRPDPESEPVLLDRRRDDSPAPSPSLPPPRLPTDPGDEVVELTAQKRPRRSRPTEVGIGALPILPRVTRDTETDLVPVRPAAPVTPVALAAKPPSGPTKVIDHDALDDGWDDDDADDADDDGDDAAAASVLGAMPGAQSSGAIALAPLAAAVPAPAARALEAAMTRSLELIRALEHAADRDAVLTLLIRHLAATHQRAGFFVLKTRTNELAVFAMQPAPDVTGFATLSLDRPSTLQDVVGTRLPYRGPVVDDASRAFLAASLGAAPAEILLVPVTVRERLVGVLFAEGRSEAATFDDQLALASRAAGLALERIVKSKRA